MLAEGWVPGSIHDADGLDSQCKRENVLGMVIVIEMEKKYVNRNDDDDSDISNNEGDIGNNIIDYSNDSNDHNSESTEKKNNHDSDNMTVLIMSILMITIIMLS